MTSLVRLRSMLVAGGLLAAATACTNKSETRLEADRAAKAVNDKVEDLKKESRHLARTAALDDVKDVGTKASALHDASNEFKYRRMVRIRTLRAVHAVAASQPMLINAFAEAFPLIESDRSEVHEKLAILKLRLDEAANVIQSLELVEAHDWVTRNDAVSKSLERVEGARHAAWQALQEAVRISDRTSMR